MSALAALLLVAPAPVAFADPGDEQGADQPAEDNQSEDNGPGAPDTSNNAQPGWPGVLDGTYATNAQYGTANVSGVSVFRSSCAGCDASFTANGASGQAIWIGGVWQVTTAGQCGPVVATITPTSVVDGYTQTITGNIVGACGQTGPMINNGVRTGP